MKKKTGRVAPPMNGGDIRLGGTVLSAGALRIYGHAGGGKHDYRGSIRIGVNASLELCPGRRQTLHNAISGEGALAVLPGATVFLRGSVSCALNLYEGSVFVAPPGAPAAVDISRLTVRGPMARWRGGLKLGAGKFLEFYVPDAVRHGATMLSFDRRFPFLPGGRADIGGSGVQIRIMGGPLALKRGETITLIDNRAGGLASDHDGLEIAGTDDIGINYGFRLSSDKKRLKATVISRS